MKYISSTTISMNNTCQIFALSIRQNAFKQRNISIKLVLRDECYSTNSMSGTTKQSWQRRKKNDNSNRTRTLPVMYIRTFVWVRVGTTLGCTNINRTKMSTVGRITILVYRADVGAFWIPIEWKTKCQL